MCLAILQLKGTKLISKGIFKIGYEQNPHGAGYMFVENGKVVVKKPFWGWQEIYESYVNDFKRCGNNSHFAIHFRLATEGSIGMANCHPHEIKPSKLALIHNGVLYIEYEPPYDPLEDKSDSAQFADYLSHFPDNFLTTDCKKELEELIGNWNKIVIMDSDNNFVILNEENGYWKDGAWYSGRVTGVEFEEGAKFSKDEDTKFVNDDWKME